MNYDPIALPVPGVLPPTQTYHPRVPPTQGNLLPHYSELFRPGVPAYQNPVALPVPGSISHRAPYPIDHASSGMPNLQIPIALPVPGVLPASELNNPSSIPGVITGALNNRSILNPVSFDQNKILVF